MGFRVWWTQMNALLQELGKDYDIYAPKRFMGDVAFSGTDCIRYGIIRSLDEVEFEEKSQYSFKTYICLNGPVFNYVEGKQLID